MRTRHTFAAALFVALFVASGLLACFPAWANAGSPMLWRNLEHLIFGNAIIGLAEGLAIALVFRLRKRWCIPLMIAANYASMLIGLLILKGVSGWAWFEAPDLLDSAIRMTAFFFVLTCLLEWPFVAFCMRKLRRWPLRSAAACVGLQAISYTILFFYYAGSMPLHIFTEFQETPLAAIPLEETVYVAYISDETGAVYVKELPSGNVWPIEAADALPENIEDWVLATEIPKGDDPAFDLLIENGPADRRVLLKDFAETASVAMDHYGDRGQLEDLPEGIEVGQLEVLLGDHAEANWDYTVYPEVAWGAGPLLIFDRTAKKRYNFYFEFPLPPLNRSASRAVVLPSGKCVLQFGEDQLILLDPGAKQYAVFARGRDPIVALDWQGPRPGTE